MLLLFKNTEKENRFLTICAKRFVKKEDIKQVKIGKRTLFDPEDLKKFIESQKTK